MPSRYRAPVAAGLAAATADQVGVDREAGIIRGASAMQAVEALGHDVLIDTVTLTRIAELGNAATGGIKVRFTHPGLCADGMGTYLGRMRDFRVQDDKVVGDIHLGEAAAKSPDGDLRDYVLQLAEEDPAAFGMSVVVEGGRVWKRTDGSEIDAQDPSLADVGPMGTTYNRPADAVGDLPFLRPLALHAVDVVDEPAANRDGMFGRGAALLALTRGTNPDAGEAFAALDAIRDRLGFTAEQAHGLLARYLAARAPATPVDAARLRALTKDHPAHLDLILDLAAAGRSDVAILAEIQRLQVADLTTKSAALLARYEADMAAKRGELAALQTQHAAALDDLKREHAGALAALQAKLAAALKLAGIVTGAPKDLGQGNAGADVDDVPAFTKAQAAAGRIPQDLLLSGAYRITPT